MASMADHTTHCDEVADSPRAYGPWNPGISADLSPRLWSLCTIFKAEKTFTTFDEAVELRDATIYRDGNEPTLNPPICDP